MVRSASLLLLPFLLAPTLLWAQTSPSPTPGQAADIPVYVPPPPAPPVLPVPPPLPHPVLDRIRAAHAVNCGLAKEEEDYSRAEDHGNRASFDIDLCKAVAVATLGPGTPLVIKSFPDEPAAIRALQTGEIDLLASTSISVQNTAKDLLLSRPVLYDGQGLLTVNRPAIKSPVDLAGKRVCFLTASNAEQGLHSYAEAQGIRYIWYPFSEAGEEEAAFFTGNCDAITSDVTSLMNIRVIDPRRANDFKLLPEIIRQDPLAAASSARDPRFAAIVNWTVEELIAAEALGVTRENVRSQVNSSSFEVQQLLGRKYGSGNLLGIDPNWGAFVIEAVGNYGQIFERDLGSGSKYNLDRGENRLWTKGGVMFGILPTQ